MFSWGILLFYNSAPTSPLFHFISVIIGGTFILAILSFVDDLYQVKFWLRLLIHIAVAIVSVWMLNPHGLLFQGVLPSSLDQIIMVVIWVGF